MPLPSLSAATSTERPLSALAAEINAAHRATIGAARTTLEHARHTGALLVTAKARVGHGAWLPWLRENCEMSVRTAEGYMRVYRLWPQLQLPNPQSTANLTRALAAIVGRRVNRAPSCEDFRCPRCNHEWSGAPRPLQPAEQRELTRMLAEMETFPFVSRTRTIVEGAPRGRDEIWTAGAGGAPVFHDIDDGAGATRGQVIRAIQRVLDGRKPTALGVRALDVARRRIRGDVTLAPAWLPPDAGVNERWSRDDADAED